MKVQRVLNENDVKKMVAEKFYCEPSDVVIQRKVRMEGYGQGERTKEYIEIVATISDNEKDDKGGQDGPIQD